MTGARGATVEALRKDVPGPGRGAADAVTIATKGLGRSFGDVTAVDAVDLQVGRGEIFGLVGPDGAGKTTLIQMLCGILDPSRGRASVLGLDTVGEADAIARRIGYMSQAFSLYGTLSVEENIDFFADLRSISPSVRRERAGRLLEFSRLTPFTDRRARDLSGGMQKKLALATMLVHEPEILFLDEPTTGVDPLSRRDFWEIVFDFLGEGTTVVVATPYLDEAERCSRVALMHEGRFLEVDTPAALKERLGGQMAEIHAEDPARAVRWLRRDREVRDAQIFGRRVHALLDDRSAYRRVEERLQREADVEIESARCVEASLEDVFISLIGRSGGKQPDGEAPSAVVSRRDGPGEAGAEEREPAIDVEGLTRRFGDFVAVDGVSFRVGRGEVFGFLGPNGSGKSTTIRMLTGILQPSAGSARIAGLDVVSDGAAIRPQVGYMSQRFSLYGDLTAGENLDFFAGAYGVPRRLVDERKSRVLAAVGLEGREHLLASDLPGGWKQRLALAAAILHEPEILFLDEPTSGVDPVSRRQFWDLIFELAGRGVTVLVTTHYMDEAERCERLALLDAGRLVGLGSPDELRSRVAGRMIELSVDRPVSALRVLHGLPGVRQATLHGAAVHVLLDEVPGREDEALRALSAAGHLVRRMGPVPLGMEDVFVALVGDRPGGKAS